MKSYLVLLKLNADESSYHELISYLKTASSWARPSNNAWLIKTDSSSVQIRDGLSNLIGVYDKVIVISISGNDWATLRADEAIVNWLKNNL